MPATGAHCRPWKPLLPSSLFAGLERGVFPTAGGLPQNRAERFHLNSVPRQIEAQLLVLPFGGSRLVPMSSISPIRQAEHHGVTPRWNSAELAGRSLPHSWKHLWRLWDEGRAGLMDRLQKAKAAHRGLEGGGQQDKVTPQKGRQQPISVRQMLALVFPLPPRGDDGPFQCRRRRHGVVGS